MIRRFLRTAAAALLDVAAVVLLIIVLAIAAGFGDVYLIAGHHLSMRSPDNPLAGLMGIAIVRLLLLGDLPLAGIPLERVDRRARDLMDRLARTSLSSGAATASIVALTTLALVVKGYFAATAPGFYSGDDVEIHEMSLAALLHQPWTVWDLRSPVFPLGVVFPAQWLASKLAVRDTAALVISGRFAVVILSTVAIPLFWRICRRLIDNGGGYALLAVAFFTVNKLQMAFGSSELPRPVATVLIVAAFMAVMRRGSGRAVLAAVLISVAAVFRFSEATFVLAAGAQLTWERRWSDLAVFGIVAGLTIAALAGPVDSWYWGDWFHSTRAVADFTLVKRLSTRGLQPPWWYLVNVAQWTTVPLVALALYGSRSPRVRAAAIWAWVPMLILSALPHKEPRYLIPVVPFVMLLATAGLADLARRIAGRTFQPRACVSAALVAILALGVIQDVAHWRLPRTDADVRLARRLPDIIPAGTTIAIEQSWRMGGRIYLSPYAVLEIDPAVVSDGGPLPDLARASWIFMDTRHASQLRSLSGFAETDDARGSGYRAARRVSE